MKASELIAELQKVEPDAEVRVFSATLEEYVDVTEVEERTDLNVVFLT